eukprot:CAMPEP_0114453416 /NCGR_PEP_ID=MMETSP0104-20121206/2034_1 /TAXON_ID=37642 ORGANISM="Paraphysomonas imperforata, Strain PA2" /NCGR_SAMPLE_ID=MMETSP0104 /ASSEMBLY_ACC=CAM_ASM_000202 /LENGTH=316 /DNA_ID=CAMNT_0001625727 /DNA_START=200 /DNA_END=1151 /DNA_ORIENTATION=+
MEGSSSMSTASVGMVSHDYYLFEASKQGIIDNINISCEKGANVNSKNAQGVTPLWEAARHGHTTAVQRLLELQGDVDKRAPNGYTAVNIASRLGYLDTVEALLDSGAINKSEMKTDVPLFGMLRDIINWILLHYYKREGVTPCWVTARYGLLGALKMLIRFNADATIADKDDYTPLHVAAQFGHTNVILYLCEIYGFDKVDCLDSQGRSPLWIAARFGFADIVEILMGAGAVMNRQDNQGVIPFYAASKEGHKHVCEKLRSLGDIRYLWEKTPPSGLYVNPQRKEAYKDHFKNRAHRNNEFMNSNVAAKLLTNDDM